MMVICSGLAGQSHVPPELEWTAEQALSCWKPMVRPVQHVGVPGYSFQTGVMWDGALVFGPLDFRGLRVMQRETAPLGDNQLHLSIGFGDHMRLVDRKGTASAAVRRELEGGRLPMPLIETRDGDLIWDERVFAHRLDRDPYSRPERGDVLVTHASFSVRNAGYAHRTAHLWLHFGDVSQVHFGYKCAQGTALGRPIAHRFAAPFGLVGEKVRYVIPAPGKGQLVWHDAVETEGVKGPAERVIEWRVPLVPGENASARIVIPYGLVDRTIANRLAALDSAVEREKARRFWERVENGPGTIQTPDPWLNDYLAAVVGQMAQQTAYRSGSNIWMYKTSPNHYEGYWPCNAAKALPVFDLRGLDDLNRKVLGSFIYSQSDSVRGMDRGVMGRDEKLAGEGYSRIPGFLGNFGEWTANPLLISHGVGMWALASHYRVTRDDGWLRGGAKSPLDAMIEGFDWVAKQRRRTMRTVDGTRVAHWGLLPAASAHDWLAGNTIFNDAWCIFGMAEVVRLLREIQHPRAEEMARELADYRACLHDRYREARDRARPLPLADGRTIPYVPRMVQELDWTKPDWTITGYGPLRAGAMGTLDPADPLVNQALAFLEAGMPRGVGPYFSAPKQYPDIADANWADVSDQSAERHFLWRHYVEYETMWPIGAHIFPARDDLPRWFEWLFNNLAVAVHRDWRVGVESLDGVPSCAPGDAERWQAVRRMFINERGGYDGSEQSLWLLQAIPRAWLRPGNRWGVKRMGTWFGGTADIGGEVDSNGQSMRISVRLSKLKATPNGVFIRLRTPDGRAPISVSLNGRAVRPAQSGLLKLGAARNLQCNIKVKLK